MRPASLLLLSILSAFAVAVSAQEVPMPPPAAPSSTPMPTDNASKGVQEGRLIHKVAPSYPPEAKGKHIEGPVTLSAIIGKDGKLRDLKIVTGDPVFTQAALDAVSQWLYEPYRLNGEPVEVETSIKINFVLPPPPALYERPDPAPTPERTDGGPQRVRVSQGVTQGLIQKKVTASYPPEAREQRIQGAVVLAALIDYDGKIKTLRLVSGHPALVPAAVDAVRQWEYKPYLLNRVPVQVETQIIVNFTLGGH